MNEPAENYPVRSSNVIEEVPTGFSSDLWLYIMTRQMIAENLEHLLKGEIIETDNENHRIYAKRGKELMNEEGVRWVTTLLGQYVTIDKISTNLSEDEVKMIASEMRLDMVQKFFMCWKDFDIKKSDLTTVIDIVDHFVFTNLTSSRNATLLEFIKPTYMRKETFQPQQQKKWYSFLPFFGGE